MNGEKPIFLQIAEGIEEAILSGAFPEESQIPSMNEFSAQYRINPATALKGMNLLTEAGILYKKRGLGMFVAQGAVEKLMERRRERFYESYIAEMVEEARRLQISREEIEQMVKEGFEK